MALIQCVNLKLNNLITELIVEVYNIASNDLHVGQCEVVDLFKVVSTSDFVLGQYHLFQVFKLHIELYKKLYLYNNVSESCQYFSKHCLVRTIKNDCSIILK